MERSVRDLPPPIGGIQFAAHGNAVGAFPHKPQPCRGVLTFVTLADLGY